MVSRVVIVGARGAIGAALLRELSRRHPGAELHAVVRSSANQEQSPSIYQWHEVNFDSPSSIEKVASSISSRGKIDRVIVCIGLLHHREFSPEKNIAQLNHFQFEMCFKVNTTYPAMIAKYFLSHLDKDKKSIFAVLSARVGSISDNRLGGWYSYRASKAALNMVIKNIAIERARVSKHNVIVALHPGTVDSRLSKPFQARVKPEKLFSPEQSAGYLLDVLDQLEFDDSGNCLAWDGSSIAP